MIYVIFMIAMIAFNLSWLMDYKLGYSSRNLCNHLISVIIVPDN